MTSESPIQLRPSGQMTNGLTSSQQLAFDLSSLDGANALVIPRVRFLLEGPLDRDLLARCVDELVARNGVLGSRFVERDGRVQQVMPTTRRSVELELVSFEGLDDATQQARWRELVARHTEAFDLEREPMLRAALVALGPERHVLLLVIHHIAFDRGSIPGMLAQLEAGYRALGDDDDWPEPPLQYIDLAAHLDEIARSKIGEQQRAHWDALLARGKPLELPVDLSREPFDARRAAHPRGVAITASTLVDKPIDAALYETLGRLGQGERASTYMVLLAGWTAMLRRLCPQDQLTYQTTYSLRGKPGARDLIGYVGNPILVGVDATGSPSYRELLVRTRNAVLAAWSHGDAPILARAPHGLRRVNFNFVPGVESSFDPEPFAPGITITQLRTPPELAGITNIPWDLHLWLHAGHDRMVLRLAYALELFCEATAADLLDRFIQTLREMCDDPDAHP